jgi:hypothetical protein
MIGSAEFEAACQSAARQYEKVSTFYPERVRRHSLAELRRRGIWPME